MKVKNTVFLKFVGHINIKAACDQAPSASISSTVPPRSAVAVKVCRGIILDKAQLNRLKPLVSGHDRRKYSYYDPLSLIITASFTSICIGIRWERTLDHRCPTQRQTEDDSQRNCSESRAHD